MFVNRNDYSAALRRFSSFVYSHIHNAGDIRMQKLHTQNSFQRNRLTEMTLRIDKSMRYFVCEFFFFSLSPFVGFFNSTFAAFAFILSH